jgi:hypothetical protein
LSELAIQGIVEKQQMQLKNKMFCLCNDTLYNDPMMRSNGIPIGRCRGNQSMVMVASICEQIQFIEIVQKVSFR